MYVQVITPNPNVPCIPDLCLVYVQDGFGNYPYVKQPTASRAWETNPTQHRDQDWPSNWFPVFFTVKGVPAGHVAIMAPDHSIYSSSSPTSHTPVHHPNLAAMQAYWHGTLGYLGWTETLEEVVIIKEETMYDAGAVNNAYLKANDRVATPDEISAYTTIPVNSGSDLLNGKVFVDLVNFKNDVVAKQKQLDEKDARIAELEKQVGEGFTPVGPLFVKK